MPTILIQTVTVKLSNGVTGRFVGPAIVDETTPKEVEVVDVSFSPPRQSPYEVKIVEQPAEPARPDPKATAPP